MKRFEILEKANEVIAQYTAMGYMVNGNDSSCGYWFKADMEDEKGTQMRIAISKEYGYGDDYDRLVLKVEHLKNGWVDKDYDVNIRSTFHILGGGEDFTEDIEDARIDREIKEAAFNKRMEEQQKAHEEKLQNMVKFEVGKEYEIFNGYIVKIVRITDKTITFVDHNGNNHRRNIKQFDVGNQYFEFFEHRLGRYTYTCNAFEPLKVDEELGQDYWESLK